MTQAYADFYVVSGAFDAAALDQQLAGMSIRFDPSKTSRRFSLLDCHDQSLRTSGVLLFEMTGSLRLVSADGQVQTQRTKGKGLFAQDLPKGPVHTALRGFPPLRALMQTGAGTCEERVFAVLDDLQKTQVRGRALILSAGDGQVSLVWVQRLRGYDRAFDAVCAAMGQLGSGGGLGAVFDGLFPHAQPYQAKPDIDLDRAEPSIQVATDIIRTYLAVARQNEAGVIADIDTEFLHDYRVALRRIRSVLSLFKGVFSDADTAELKQVFSDLMAPTGRLRDLDVYLLEKDMYFSLIPENLHVGLRAMFDRFEADRKQQLARLTRKLRSKAYHASMTELNACFKPPGHIQPGANADRPAFDYACALIWKRYRKVCKLARSIDEETPDQIVHDLRIDCKKLRYLMEFFAPLFDDTDFKTIIKPLKKLQDNLGRFNDCSVQQDSLLAFVKDQSTAQDQVSAHLGLAAGGLVAVLDQRQRAERGRVIANFQHFDSPKIRTLVRRMFHQSKE